MLLWQLAEIKCSGNYNNPVRRHALQLISWPCRNSWDCSDVIFIPHPQKLDSFHLWTETMSERPLMEYELQSLAPVSGPGATAGLLRAPDTEQIMALCFVGLLLLFWCSCWCGVSGFSWTPTAACRPHRGRIIKTVWSGDSSITRWSSCTVTKLQEIHLRMIYIYN